MYYLFNPTGNITALVDDDTPAEEVFRLEPSCEQVGYIYQKPGYDIAVRMAGGEFCGNASLCAAYLTKKKNAKLFFEGTGDIDVSFEGNIGSVKMPEAIEITKINGYPLVRFKGIDHVIIQDDDLDPELIKSWCMGEAMGFMYLKRDTMKPLVFVKSINTLFWENSCASGTTAVGIYRGTRTRLSQPGGVLEFNDGRLIGKVELIKKV